MTEALTEVLHPEGTCGQPRTTTDRFARTTYSPVRFPEAQPMVASSSRPAVSSAASGPPPLPLAAPEANPVFLQTTGSQTDVAVMPGHQHPTSASTRPAMRQAAFPTYDGKTDYAFYRAQFLALASSRPMSEWAEALVVALREPASHVLSTLTAEQLTNFSELDSALLTRFGRPRPRNIAVQNLKAARQQPGQTLREFGVQVDLLCRDAYRDDPVVGRSPSVLNKLVLDNFMAGIADPATRRLLLMSRPHDLTTALATASELEDAPPPVQRVRQVEAEAVTLPLQDNNTQVPAAALATALSKLTAAVCAVRQAVSTPALHQHHPSANAQPDHLVDTKSRTMQWTRDGRPICRQCKEVGHTSRDCDA